MITDLPSTQSAMLSVWARRAPPGHLLSEWRPMTQTQARMVESHIKQYLEGPPLTLHSTKIQVGTFPVSVYALVYFQDYLGLQILHIIFSHDVRRACLNLVCVFVFFRRDLPVSICLWQGQLCHSHADLCSGWWRSSCPRQCQSQH